MVVLGSETGGGSGSGGGMTGSGMSGSTGMPSSGMTSPAMPGMGMSGGASGNAAGGASMGHDHMSMTMPLLPAWLVTTWVVALGLVLLLHLWHVWSMNGRPRLWHLSHVVMAGGMIVMYAVPQQDHAGLYDAGVAVFGVLALVMTSAGAHWWRQERVLNWLWAASTIDMLIMGYMALPASERDVVLTSVAIAYLVAEIVIWLSDPVPRVRRLLRRRSLQPAESGPDTMRSRAAGAADPAAAAAGDPQLDQQDADRETVRLAADITVGVRVTLAVMAASMAWMLVAMHTMAPMAMG